MINALYFPDSIRSASSEAFKLYDKSVFGEKKGSAIIYSPIEALFLAQERKIIVYKETKKLSEEKILKLLRKNDKRISTKLAVYSDLRKKGYIVKTALKFGAEFRVYEKGVKPGENHARWVLSTAREHEQLNWHDFTAKNRVAHAAKKYLLLGIVDDEGDVSYYEIAWIKP